MRLSEPTWKAGRDVRGQACPCCGNYSPLEPGDELEVWPCHHDTCTEKGGRCCRIKCFSCDLTFCPEHVVQFGEKLYCFECMKGLEEEGGERLAEELESPEAA